MGYPMHYTSNQQIWDEMRALCPLFYGVTYEKMGEMGHVQWPCPTLDHPGTPYLYKDNHFDTPTGKGQLFAAPGERPLKHLTKTILWCSARCAKWDITPVVP